MQQVKYPLGDGRALAISSDADQTMLRFASGATTEAGGILLGRIYPDAVVIESVTTPSRRDKAARFWFNRDVSAAQKRVTAAWQQSGGTLIYLGEWHTHPEAQPTPSTTDRALIANMLRDSKMEIDFLFLVINGLRGRWVGMQTSDGLEPLHETH